MSAGHPDAEIDAEAIAEQILAGTDPYVVPDELVAEPTPPAALKNLHHEIQHMSMGQRLKLALRGNRDARSILIHDSSPAVQRFVMRNPRLTEDEVLQFAKNRSLDSDVMLVIGKRKEWVRNYQVRLCLVTNPKTPIGLALRFVHTLGERDIRALAKNRNIPSAVNASARRMLEQGKFRR